DLEKGTGCYSAAGHPPLLHYRAAERTVESVVENGLILGVLPLASYEAKVLEIRKGDRFLLYTDGVVEAARNGEEFGEHRVKDVLTRTSNAESICQAIAQEITSWTQGVAGDDVTIVAVSIA